MRKSDIQIHIEQCPQIQSPPLYNEYVLFEKRHNMDTNYEKDPGIAQWYLQKWLEIAIFVLFNELINVSFICVDWTAFYIGLL